MMKNIRIMLLMALLTVVGNASADELTVSNVAIKAGETKTISIELNNPDKDYIAFEFDITFPDGISIVTDENDLFVASFNEERSNGHNLDVSKNAEDGNYHFLGYAYPNKSFKGNSGELIQITISCDANASKGNYNATVEEIIFSDTDKKEVDFDDFSFGVNIFVPGDVNSDGRVTPADAIMILYHYFNVAQSGFNVNAADMNGDGSITPADAIEALYKYFNSAGGNNARHSKPTGEPE